MITIEYNTPVEVTQEQYHFIMGRLSGICAGREENGKYFIKVWIMKYAYLVSQFLTQTSK